MHISISLWITYSPSWVPHPDSPSATPVSGGWELQSPRALWAGSPCTPGDPHNTWDPAAAIPLSLQNQYQAPKSPLPTSCRCSADEGQCWCGNEEEIFEQAEWVFLWLQPSGQHSLFFPCYCCMTFLWAQGLFLARDYHKYFFSRAVTAPEQGIILLQELRWNKEDILDKWEIINLDQPRLARVTNVTFLQAMCHPSTGQEQMVFQEITHSCFTLEFKAQVLFLT